MRLDCGREADVLEALTSGRWPEACAPELRAHVAGCGNCADLVQVVLAVTADHADATRLAPIPSGAIVWWRAQMRARQEAARVASRPITVVQGLTLASAVALCAASAGAAFAFFRSTLPSVEGLVGAAKAFLPTSPAEVLLTPHGVAIAMIAAIWLIGAPLALYLSGTGD